MHVAIIFTLSLLSSIVFAQTEYEITLNKNLTLFSQPELSAEPIRELQKGETVRGQLSNKKYFLKVEALQDGEVGFIYTKKLKGSKIKKRRLRGNRKTNQFAKTESSNAYIKNYGLGLRYSQVEMSQGAYSEVVNEVQYSFDDFKSSSPSFELQLSLPTKSHWNIRISFVNRTTSFESKAEVVSINQDDVDVLREQTLFGVGLNANYYFRKQGWLYLITGIEIDKGTNVDLKFGEQKLVSSEEDLPFFALIRVGVGADIRLFKSLYLNPELRIGVDANADPMTHFYSLGLGLNWQM